MKKYKIFFIFTSTLLILLLGSVLCFLSGQESREKIDSFLHFCESISSESLEIASVSKGFGVEETTKDLSIRDKQKLVHLLKTTSANELHLKEETPALEDIKVYLYLRTNSQEYAMQFVPGKGIYILSAKLNDEEDSSYCSKVLWLESSLLEEYVLSFF